MKSSDKIKKQMKAQGYRFIGNHSAVKICRWTKKSLRNEGVCYKEKFYGIKSHQCCQMTPWLGCENNCVHCWRAIELDFNKIIDNKISSPKEIIDNCIIEQRKLLEGFKILPETADITVSKVNMKKYNSAQEPMQFAISLSGEPTLYSNIGGLIEELRKRGKTSFLVTNGLHPEKIKELSERNQLPTQLYVSINSSNKELYEKFHRSSMENAWEKLNKTLELLKDLDCRTIFRMNLVLNLNMEDEMVEQYAGLIKKSGSDFVELKGFMSVGFARERLGYDRMPTWEDVLNYAEKIAKATGLKVLDSHKFSRAVVLGMDKAGLRIK